MPSATLARGKGRRKRVLSGMRPTGRLHIGHYFGALSNWIRMQDEYECFYFVADWHALTTDYANPVNVAENSIQIGIDWLAAGLDPAKCTMFVQSQVPEHAELHLLLSMVTPLGWLERVPTYKEQREQNALKDLGTHGFLGYPVLQSADILMYSADCVPVGEDQVAHVEITREICRRFVAFYCLYPKAELYAPANRPALKQLLAAVDYSREVPASGVLSGAQRKEYETTVRRRIRGIGSVAWPFIRKPGWDAFFEARPPFAEPQALLTPAARLPGTDGRKMSKSYGNVIELGETDDSIREKVRGMMTDPQRVRRQDPGRPEVCPVFAYHKLFSTPETIAWSEQGCRTAGIGCVDCKAAMAESLVRWIEPIRARRREYEVHPERVREVLAEGSKKAQKVARKTMRRVREAVFGSATLAASRRAAPTKTQTAAGD